MEKLIPSSAKAFDPCSFQALTDRSLDGFSTCQGRWEITFNIAKYFSKLGGVFSCLSSEADNKRRFKFCEVDEVSADIPYSWAKENGPPILQSYKTLPFFLPSTSV